MALGRPTGEMARGVLKALQASKPMAPPARTPEEPMFVSEPIRAHPAAEPSQDIASLRLSVTVTSSDCVPGPKNCPVIPGRFRLFEKLGQGGMGVVHRAFDSDLRHEVALKSINVAQPDDLYRLKREFRLLADLQHPNLVRLYELFAEGCHAFFTMELLFGSALHGFVQEQRAGASPRCDYRRLRGAARELASALAAVHEAGSLHRDIKPSNILVTPAGRLVLFDFGLAASLSPTHHTTEKAGVLLGTRGYISPEQARGEVLTVAADWYSFGVTLFEAATGHLPFDDPFKPFLADHRDEGLARISRYLPDAPPELDDLIAGLLDSSASRRPSEREILAVLGDSPDFRVSSDRRGSSGAGRRKVDGFDEGALTRGLDRVRGGQSAVLHLHGAPGVGKSFVARRMVDAARDQGACVLRGRCRFQENVAFNAMDEVIDDLSHALAGMPYAELVAALPTHVEAVPRLFPVLGRLEARVDGLFSPSPEAGGETLKLARVALKELLAGFARGRPLVIWIDDAQWGDRQSGELLGELLQPIDAPPILLLLSYRSDEGPNRGMLEVLGELDAAAFSFDVALKPCADSQEKPRSRCCT